MKLSIFISRDLFQIKTVTIPTSRKWYTQFDPLEKEIKENNNNSKTRQPTKTCFEALTDLWPPNKGI